LTVDILNPLYLLNNRYYWSATAFHPFQTLC